MPLNPYPNLKSQLVRLQAVTLRVLGPDSSPRPAVGGRAPRSLPGGVRSRSPSRRPFLLRQLPFSRGFAPYSVPFLHSLSPRTPRRPRPPHLPPLSDRGHSQFSRPPRLPEHRETPVTPRLSGPGATRSGSPPLADPRRSGLFRKPHTHGLPSLSPGPPLGSPRDLSACPSRSPAPTYLPDANSDGRNPADLPPRPTPTHPGPQPRPPASASRAQS